MILTPTFHVFEMYTVHHDAKRLPTEVQCAPYPFGPDSIPSVNASASRDQAGKIHVTLCNLNPNQPAAITFGLSGAKASQISGRVLTAADIRAHNTFEKPDNIQPAEFRDFKTTEGGFTATLPAKSVVALEVE